MSQRGGCWLICKSEDGGHKMKIPRILDPGDFSLSIVVFNLELKVYENEAISELESITRAIDGSMTLYQ
jgi:hypothetical protein